MCVSRDYQILLSQIMYKVLMVMGEVYIGLRTATLPPIEQLVFIYHWDYIFMDTREMSKGIKLTTLFPITIVDYKLSNQGSLEMLLLEV